MANKAPTAGMGKEGQYARFMLRVGGIGTALPEEKPAARSEQSIPSASPDIPLSPDDSVMEHAKQVYEKNPVLWGSILALAGLWACVKLNA